MIMPLPLGKPDQTIEVEAEEYHRDMAKGKQDTVPSVHKGSLRVH